MNDQDDTVRKFVHKLLEEQGIQRLELGADVREELEKDLIGRVHDRINAALLSGLSRDKTDEFEKLLESGSEEDIKNFFSREIPDLEQFIAGELLAFRRTYLGVGG